MSAGSPAPVSRGSGVRNKQNWTPSASDAISSSCARTVSARGIIGKEVNEHG